jgi:hypothetical protein
MEVATQAKPSRFLKGTKNTSSLIGLIVLGIICTKTFITSLYQTTALNFLTVAVFDQPSDSVVNDAKKDRENLLTINVLSESSVIKQNPSSTIRHEKEHNAKEVVSSNNIHFDSPENLTNNHSNIQEKESKKEEPCVVADHFRYEGVRLESDRWATNQFLFTEFSKYSSIKSHDGKHDCNSYPVGQVIVARHGASEQSVLDFAESPADTVQPYLIAEWGKSGFYFLDEQSQDEQRNLALFWGKQRQEAYGSMNVFGVMHWSYENNQIRDVEKYAPKSAWVHADAFYPPCLKLDNVIYDIPWTEGLRNKTILIVHPFIDTIKEQIPKLLKIWSKVNATGAPSSCMPIDTIDQVKFVRTQLPLTNPTKSWIDVFNGMKQEIIDVGHFDVALVSCGGFGLPLLAHISTLPHKPSGIYLGGALQLFFGIHGARWYSNGDWYQQWQESYTDAWTWPLDSDVSFSTVGQLESAAYVKPGQAGS